MFSFLLESSPTPIYQRITAGYRQALERQNHSVVYIEPSRFSGFDEAFNYFRDAIASQNIDYFIVFDNSPISTFYLPEIDSFLFEIFKNKMIFIHHDNLWSSLVDARLLAAWRKVGDRSFHFCLEYANFLDLRMLGFERVYPIFHGSEFKKIATPDSYMYDVSFVGHVLPDLKPIFEQYQDLPCSHFVAADFWSRIVALDKKINTSAIAYASRPNNTIDNAEFIARKSTYYYLINLLSPCFRGELIKRLDSHFNLAIVGGDPGYLSGLSSERKIESETIAYYPPVVEYASTQNLYASSKINLNITSIQFDDAVVNRVIDVAFVGGFILTDWKPDLCKLTSVSEQISYRSIEELNRKIIYYLTHEEERLAIAAQLHQDISEKCSYDNIIEFMMNRIGDMPSDRSEIVKVDLGCGIHKPEGFIGVDLSFKPGVDIVADLNQTFPFPDNSVDFVRAHDTIEHLSDRIHTMNEIWRICKPNAQIDIRVPSTDGRGAFQDPTHISFWNINSFQYYCIEFPAYFELCQSYGFKGAFRTIRLYDEEESPDKVIHTRAILAAYKPARLLEILRQKLNLKEINLIIFPDWSQPEEVLYAELIEVIRASALHPENQQIALLVDQSNFPPDSEASVEQIFYELAFNLCLNEGIDIANEQIQISFIENLSPEEWAVLIQQISYRISLPHENLKSANIINGISISDLYLFKNSQ